MGSVITKSTKPYCKMVYDHFNDNRIYNKIDKTCDNTIMNKIKKTNPEVSKYFNQGRHRFFSFNKQFLWSPKNSPVYLFSKTITINLMMNFLCKQTAPQWEQYFPLHMQH